MKNELEARKKIILTLAQATDIGYYTIRKLYRKDKRLERLSEYNLDDLIRCFVEAGVKYSDRCARNFFHSRADLIKEAKNLYDDLIKRNVNFILEDEPMFPHSLRVIPDNPYWLFVEGNPEILNLENIVAVVGTRNPTGKGIEITKELTRFLVKNRFIILSGLAQGIDEATHETTNQLGGKGVAVLGCGINLPFPAKTYRIRQAITSNSGAIVSEYMPKDFYSKKSFYWRNRLQSGLSRAIIPIQGSYKSGTSHTINFAETQKKIIIGVYLDEVESIVQNEILRFLKTRKYPVFNINGEQNKILNAIETIYEKQRSFEQVPLFVLEEERSIEDKQEDVILKKKNIIQRIFSKIRLKIK